MAIGVARRGARRSRSGERTLRIPPSCSGPVSHHAGGPHVASFVVGRPCARARACVRAGMAICAGSSDRPCAGMRACLYVGMAQSAASSEDETAAGQKEDGNPEQEEKGAARAPQSREGRGWWEQRVMWRRSSRTVVHHGGFEGKKSFQIHKYDADLCIYDITLRHMIHMTPAKFQALLPYLA